MNVHVSIDSPSPAGDYAADGHLVFEGLDPGDGELEIDRAMCARRGFDGKAGESMAEHEGDRLLVLVGAGERGRLGVRSLRRAAATFARAAASCPSARLDLAGAAGALSTAVAVQAAVEGIGGATYRFSRFKTNEQPAVLDSVVLTVPPGDDADARRGLERGVAVADAVQLVRDLVNTPASDMTPSDLAATAAGVAEGAGLAISVLDELEIQSAGLGGLWGVARGSAQPPRLVKLTYEPEGATAGTPTVAIVGKGITFDSGGLSLKSGEGMMTMKDDMSGAAVVIAALGACRAAGVGVRVIGIAPCTENMPSGTATKPGDVLTTRNGKTIEVLNTDAEGRLVLADGLALAVEEGVDAIVDLATLTGACVVALGHEVAGLMGNDSRIVTAVEQAAERAGEPVWHLPLPQAYKKLHESSVADMKNVGRPGGPGALLAGLILEEFVGDRPWVHLDIAGPAFTDEDAYDQRKGATGFGVRTIIQLLSDYQAIGTPADHTADGSIR